MSNAQPVCFTLVVSAAPNADATPVRFARAVLEFGHRLPCVFFLRDGVQHAAADSEIAQSWHDLQRSYPELELALCIGAAERRGIPEQAGAVDAPGFVHVGLGQLVAALAEAERVVDFPA